MPKKRFHRRAFTLTILAGAALLANVPALSAQKWHILCTPNVTGMCGNTIPVNIQGQTFDAYLPDLLLSNGWDGTSPVKALVTVQSGAQILATTTAKASFRTGVLPVGSTIVMKNYGLIAGKGGDAGMPSTGYYQPAVPSNTMVWDPQGNGGYGSWVSSQGLWTNPGGPPPSAGQPGGPALDVQHQMSMANHGTIAGGGGGGGVGASGLINASGYFFGSPYMERMAGGGGGGGAGGGKGNGPQGTAQRACSFALAAVAGNDGTFTAGGTGGARGYGTCGPNMYLYGGKGGDGGGLGQPGQNGDVAFGSTEHWGWMPRWDQMLNTWATPYGRWGYTDELPASAGGQAGPVTTTGSNAKITWDVPGTRLGQLK